MSQIQSEILTVMFIDIVNYTDTTAHMDREMFSRLQDAFDNLSIPLFEKYNGYIVKKMGDAFLLTFKSPTDAVLCGIDIQNTFERYNRDHQLKYPLKVRVALHTGEVMHRDGDIYGDAVNIAARIESVTGPGEIIFSKALFLAMNKNEIPFINIGLRNFKGSKYPVRLFRVKGHYDKILRRKKRKKTRKLRAKNLLVNLGLLGSIAVVIFFVLYYLYNHSGLVY